MLSKGYRRFLARISKESLSDFHEAHIPAALLDLMQPGGERGDDGGKVRHAQCIVASFASSLSPHSHR